MQMFWIRLDNSSLDTLLSAKWSYVILGRIKSFVCTVISLIFCVITPNSSHFPHLQLNGFIVKVPGYGRLHLKQVKHFPYQSFTEKAYVFILSSKDGASAVLFKCGGPRWVSRKIIQESWVRHHKFVIFTTWSESTQHTSFSIKGVNT